MHRLFQMTVLFFEMNVEGFVKRSLVLFFDWKLLCSLIQNNKCGLRSKSKHKNRRIR